MPRIPGSWKMAAILRRRAVKWDEVGLGTDYDHVLAKRYGVSKDVVRRERTRLGIAAYVPPSHAIDWDQQPLGRVPDRVLAERLGVHWGTVSRMRCERFVPAVPKSHQLIDWDAEPLGQVSDRALALRLGVSNTAAAKHRQKRGIPRYSEGREPRIDWDAQPFGEIPDAAIARRLGVGTSTVGNQREKRGIAPRQPPDKIPLEDRPADPPEELDWDAQPLGQVPDVLLALKLQVPEAVVVVERNARGIPPPSGWCCPGCARELHLTRDLPRLLADLSSRSPLRKPTKAP